MRASIVDGLEGLSYGPLGRGLGWSREEVEVLLVGVRKSLRDGNGVHCWFPVHFVYGIKPLE